MSLVREGLRIRSLIVVLWRASLRDPRTDWRATLDPCFSTRATPDPRTWGRCKTQIRTALAASRACGAG
jgi:hypothetical protein